LPPIVVVVGGRGMEGGGCPGESVEVGKVDREGGGWDLKEGKSRPISVRRR